MTKVREAMVFTIDAMKVGEVYLKLAKYMFKVKPTLQPLEKTLNWPFILFLYQKHIGFLHVLTQEEKEQKVPRKEQL
ncbi:unnamed protein product [Prunus armeniaca]|uniref:Uncharacterized protein n=1 Tax=Prunus armeniaca TaxID=36596 RepID=A0A6J5VVF0_PRUAR|nr:unnamed protein product [Prunus armeniaca]